MCPCPFLSFISSLFFSYSLFMYPFVILSDQLMHLQVCDSRTNQPSIAALLHIALSKTFLQISCITVSIGIKRQWVEPGQTHNKKQELKETIGSRETLLFLNDAL
ncbi:hypothetical protein BKA57DRAFT_477772, partial [Linnemannia elongata]